MSARLTRRDFARAALGALAAGCAGRPPPETQAALLNDNIPPPDCGEDLRVTFENNARPVLLGARVKGIFNGDEYQVPEKWFGVLGRHAMLMKTPGNAEVWEAWLSQFDHVRSSSIAKKVRAVSEVIDRELYYEFDEVTHKGDRKKQREYWSSPIETLARRQGDCEDLAILKYFTLRDLGVPESKLYLLVVNGARENAGEHSTLLVDMSEGGPGTFTRLRVSESYPRRKTPRKEALPERKGYTLYYAMNETGIWAVPENTARRWGRARPEPSACVSLPGKDPKTILSSKTAP